MLQSKSMLVDLTISKWTATKHDRAVSLEIETAHSAKDAGRYNKRLIDKTHLAKIDTLAGAVRKYHYSRTLPWTDKGQRLLPSAIFMEYRTEIANFKAQYEKAVDEFLAIYPQLVQDARLRLNTMFQPEDYPQVDYLRKNFGIDLEIMPVPDAADFRVDVAQETQDEIRDQIMQSVNARQVKAVKDCWARVREVVSRISEQCGKKDGRIHDSLIDNARDLVSVLKGLNITNDPEISAVEAEIATNLLVNPERLRNSPSTRRAVADAADDILKRMPWAS